MSTGLHWKIRTRNGENRSVKNPKFLVDVETKIELSLNQNKSQLIERNTMDEKSNQIVISLLRLGAFLSREGNRIVADTGLNQQQYVVLNHIHSRGPVCQKDICASLLFEKSNVSKIVKKLSDLSFLKKESSSDDGRLHQLTITEKGEKIIVFYNSLFDGWNESWLKSLSEEERLLTIVTLNRLSRLN